MVTGVCQCGVSALWSVYFVSNVCLCEVCELFSMRVVSGVCLCEMYAQWSVSVQCVWGVTCVCVRFSHCAECV